MSHPNKIARHAAADLALYMLQHGYQGTIIQDCTGLTDSMVRAYRQELERSGEINAVTAGKLKSSPRIVDTRRQMASASLLMASYRRIAANPRHQVDVMALTEAYVLYVDAHESYGLGGAPLSINEAYILARDYADDSGRRHIELRHCGCGADYLVVAEQRIAPVCPLCSLKGLDDERHSVGEAMAVA